MKHNETLKNEVLEAIRVEPLLKGVLIDVSADEGIVTLSARVDSYVKKRAAEQVARIVPGVHAVVGKINVEFGSIDKKSNQMRHLLQKY